MKPVFNKQGKAALRFIGWLSITLIALIGMSLSMPFANHKAFADSGCYELSVCMWEHERAEGAKLTYYDPIPGKCYTLPTSWWDRVSSIWNRTWGSIKFYVLEQCSGSAFYTTVYSGEYRGTLWGSGFNDEIRSFCRGC